MACKNKQDEAFSEADLLGLFRESRLSAFRESYAKIDEPDWALRSTGDWQSEVPEEIRGIWHRLSRQSRAIAFLFAFRLARDAMEAWDD
jgi:hypothetical protein